MLSNPQERYSDETNSEGNSIKQELKKLLKSPGYIGLRNEEDKRRYDVYLYKKSGINYFLYLIEKHVENGDLDILRRMINPRLCDKSEFFPEYKFVDRHDYVFNQYHRDYKYIVEQLHEPAIYNDGLGLYYLLASFTNGASPSHRYFMKLQADFERLYQKLKKGQKNEGEVTNNFKATSESGLASKKGDMATLSDSKEQNLSPDNNPLVNDLPREQRYAEEKKKKIKECSGTIFQSSSSGHSDLLEKEDAPSTVKNTKQKQKFDEKVNVELKSILKNAVG
jgi:hypothetical protein